MSDAPAPSRFDRLSTWLVVSILLVLMVWFWVADKSALTGLVAIVACLPATLVAVLVLRLSLCLSFGRAPDLWVGPRRVLQGSWAVIVPLLLLALVFVMREGLLGEVLAGDFSLVRADSKCVYNSQVRTSVASRTRAGTERLVRPDGTDVVNLDELELMKRSRGGEDMEPGFGTPPGVVLPDDGDALARRFSANLSDLEVPGFQLGGEIRLRCPLPGWQLPLYKNQGLDFQIEAKLVIWDDEGDATLQIQTEGRIDQTVLGFASRRHVRGRIGETLGVHFRSQVEKQLEKLSQELR